jgi:hypothetical protein
LSSYLGKDEQQLLMAVAHAVNFSLKGHVPKHAIMSKYRKDRRGSAANGLKLLNRAGLVAIHPTRGETTWQLTRNGLLLAMKQM